MRLVGCIRVSRVGGRSGVSFISPDVQREQIIAYAGAHGHELVGWQEDLDRPGSTLTRPGLQAALAAVANGQADGIIAAKLDRITRSIADLGKLLTAAQDGGWNLVAVDVGLDLQTPNGKLVAHVLGAIAEWELDRRRSDWNLARARAVERGVHVASRTPTGYRRRDDATLEIDAETGPVVRELFARRALGDGWTKLARFLTDEGVLTPYGNEVWTQGAVRTLVTNRVYVGEARSGAHVKAGAHEAIVTEAEWQAAQAATIKPTSERAEVALLSGLVRCASCRYIAKSDSMRDRDGTRLGMYRCRGRHAAGHCPQPVSILSRSLDRIVEEQMLAWLERGGPTGEAHQATAELDAALRDVAEAESELLAFVASETLAIAGAHVFEHGLAVRRQRLDQAKETVGTLQSRVVNFGQLTPSDLHDAWPDLTVPERRELIAAAVDAVVVWPHRSGGLPADRVRIVWAGEAPDDLPGRGRRVPLAPWPGSPPNLGMPAA